MTVKGRKRGRPAGKQGALSAQAILKQAKNIMKDEKKIPSIRQLAAGLNVDAMAIYYYFSNKNALLESITTSLIEDIYQPQVSDNWKNELTKLCTSYLVLLDDYPGLLNTMLCMNNDGPAQVFTARFNTVIEPLNLNDKAKKNALYLLVDYLHGYALALNCQNDELLLTVNHLSGPLNFYCIALENI